MCEPKRPKGAVPPCFDEILDRVLEDRAEIVPFRRLGGGVSDASFRQRAHAGWDVQLLLIGANSTDPAITVAAHQVISVPSRENIQTLLRTVAKTPWFAAVQDCLVDLALAHLDTVFADGAE